MNERKNQLEKIESFTIDHLRLLPGVYVSRKDKVGEKTVTTFDIRITRPNFEPVINTAELHTIEHLAATYLRNHQEYGPKTLYFGPMGCRTGFYVIFSGDLKSEDIIDLLKEMADYILAYEGDIPGYSPRDCGNYLDNNLNLAKIYIKKYKEEVLDNPTAERLNYPN